MKFIDNNIEFTNVQKAGINTGSGPIAIKDDYLDDEENPGYINKYKTSNNKCQYVVNAIDIDWNGAQIDEDTTINTTGELISWISSKGSDDCPECVVSNDRFEQKTTTDLSGNNILQLFVKDEETPIFQIGGANSKIQKSMLSDEVKGLLEGNPGEPVGNLTFNTNDFSISETNKVSLSDNIVRTTGDQEEVILADGSTKPLSEFGVVKGINKIDFYRWEEVIIPNSTNKGFVPTDRLSFQITKNGVIVKDFTIDIKKTSTQETTDSFPFKSLLTDFNSSNNNVLNIGNNVNQEGDYVNEIYVEDDCIIHGGILFNYKLNKISSSDIINFFKNNKSKLGLLNSNNFKIDNKSIFDNDSEIIITIPQNKLVYRNVPVKTFKELNAYQEILNGRYVYVARTVKKEEEQYPVGGSTFGYTKALEEIRQGLEELSSGNVTDKMLSFFKYSDSGLEIVKAINNYIQTNNNTNEINIFIQNAVGLTMAIYELQYFLKHRELSNNYLNALSDNNEEIGNTYGIGKYLVLNDDYEYDVKYYPSLIQQSISNYYKIPDTLIKTSIPLESDINVTARWSDLISND